MQEEVEVKFLEVDHDQVRSKLASLGATLEHPNRLMRRTMFDFPDGKLAKSHARLRVRDEDDKLTVTYKSEGSGSYAHEIETTIGSYQAMTELLEAIGLHGFSVQESKRETWRYDNVEIVLDEWPWLAPYIEIEGPDEASIRTAASALGFDWADAKYGSVDTAYCHQYPGMTQDETIGAIGNVSFEGTMPSWLKDRM